MDSTREALEAALVADPDDVVLHSAYADLLIEAGDPRGDYVRLQLALEDRNQPAERLRAMEQEAFALRQAHEAEWLGPLAEFVLPTRGPTVGAMVAENVEVTWRRGWVHGLTIPNLTTEIGSAIWGSFHILSLLAGISILRITDLFQGDLGRMLRWHEGTLRKLTIGDMTGLDHLFGDVPTLPRLEELSLTGILTGWLGFGFSMSLGRLQSLEITTVDRGRMPLEVLGQNPTITQLQRLHLDVVTQEQPQEVVSQEDIREFFRSPHLRSLEYLALRLPGFQDAGVDELISSGLIARLRGLDLCRCEITDDGAQELAACPDVPRLEYLHLDNNFLSPVGIQALAAVGVTVSGRQMYGDWGDV